MVNQIHDLTAHEIAVFADLIHDLARADGETDPREIAAARLLTLFRADTLASYVWDETAARYGQPISVNHDPAKVDRYVDGLQFQDPLTRRMRRLRGARIVETVFPMRALERTEFFNDFLKPDGMYHGMNVFFEAGAKNVFDLRIWRSRKRDPFGDREILLLNLITGYLTSAIQTFAMEDLSILSPREREVGRLIARGCTDKEIADLLGIRFSTVRTHVNRCFDKLECSNRAELSARFASCA